MTLTNSTLTNNTAGEDAGGGGIFNASGGAGRPGTVTLTNCTLAYNTASAGGGIYTDGGTVTLTNSTLAYNTASGADGGGGIALVGNVQRPCRIPFSRSIRPSMCRLHRMIASVPSHPSATT